MKGLSYVAAFLGGAAVGAVIGILFAPQSGDDSRKRITTALRKRGVKLDKDEMEELVNEISDQLRSVVD